MSKDQAVILIEQYTSGKIAWPEFAEQFTGLYFSVRRDPASPADLCQICSAAIGPFSEYSRCGRSEASLREALEKAIHNVLPLASTSDRLSRT